MKKTYIKPDMQVVIMTSHQAVLTTSAKGLDNFGGYGGVSDDDDEGD